MWGSVYWYILVLAESAIVIFFLGTGRWKTMLYIAIGFGFVLGFIYDNKTTIALFSTFPFSYVNKAFYTVFSWSNSFIMKGVPFMGIGYLFFEKSPEFSMKEINLKAAVAGLLLATGMNFFLFINGKAIHFLFIVQAVSIFIIGLACEIDISTTVSIRFRELSSCIYFVHTFIIYDIIDTYFGLEWVIVLRYFTAVLLSCLVYVMMKYIIKTRDIYLLRFMFNIRRETF